ncbi:uracil-DNA glycosylase [Steroidobacter sp.]|uniref:uracil-DNA glycosylase n=1 Tax=Steroidobacter sp. TaxID=1978227 RepID=UPI001A569255|nr:uracil-DNA glycosylase [Steroidobacter sp.]MBL8269845.1 uracil-DNA glycosylase [Steroidobacter sp.]
MSKPSARKSLSVPRTTKSAPPKQLALVDDQPGNGLWPSDGEVFDRTCTDCPRLAKFLEAGRKEYPDYYSAPVAPFGDRKARLIIIGLAPGFHGANATGRPFTGDYAGVLLYQTLHKFGFASKPESIHRNDGLQLLDARISNAVKCVPPDNKPLPDEVTNCNHYLQAELAAAPKDVVLLALGSIGHNAVLRTLGLKPSAYKFGHAAEFELPGGQRLIDSYHCSRYNTNTRRLTPEMFEAVFARARQLIQK